MPEGEHRVSNENHERGKKESAASFSEREIEAHAGASADEKTLLRTPTPAADQPPISNEKLKDPTRNFVASSEAQTALQSAPDTEPTKIFSNDETKRKAGEPEIEAADEEKDAPNENALRPSRLRFALVCLLFVNMFIVAGMNIYQAFLLQSALPFGRELKGDRFVIVNVRQGFEGAFQVGDELVSVNGIEVNIDNDGQLNNLKRAHNSECENRLFSGRSHSTNQIFQVAISC